MLDAIRMLMTEALGLTTKEVTDLREALLTEQATEDARYAATSALAHPKGSTTPINEAFSRAQLAADKARDKAMKDVPKALALLLAAEVAMQRRDEAKLHRDMKEEGKAFKQETGLHAAAADWFERLARHGVHPHYLKQHSNETVAIIADLITWKAKDAKFEDAENPWRAILGIYAGRVIDKPGQVGTPKRSKAGMPKGSRHRGGSEHYRFDLMLSPSWGEVAPPPHSSPEPVGTPSSLSSSSTQPLAEAAPTGEPTLLPSDVMACDPTKKDAVSDADGLIEGGNAVPPSDPVPASPRPPMTRLRAQEIAERLRNQEATWLRLYWPRDVAINDYDSHSLIPALEAQVAKGAWSGIREFLDAARLGRGPEYINEVRQVLVESTVLALIRGEPTTIEEARKAGFDV